MAYNELIKNFERIRDYMRQFYVYGFKSRNEYDAKSARSYDDERRRIESWLGDYMKFQRTAEGKSAFLSIDSRVVAHNPLYTALKAKSFTDFDITLHFIIFDILFEPGIRLTLNDMIEIIDTRYLNSFKTPLTFDESTLRKKLKEYIAEGIIRSEKDGRKMVYSRMPDIKIINPEYYRDCLDFFSEIMPCGVIGSFLLDKKTGQGEAEHHSFFGFKHNFITYAIDSDILCRLFEAMRDKRMIEIETYRRRFGSSRISKVVPVKVFISSQNGREHLLAYNDEFHRFDSYRIDYILKIKIAEEYAGFDKIREKFNTIQSHMWGVISASSLKRLEHIEFTLHIGKNEEYIFERLDREKRCGTVERIDAETCRFTADVISINEMIPWIRTFICRIKSLNFSNRKIENQFKADLEEMYRIYGLAAPGSDSGQDADVGRKDGEK